VEEESQFSAWLIERKKSNKEKCDVAGVPDRSHEGLGPTFLAHLDSHGQKLGLGTEKIKIRDYSSAEQMMRVVPNLQPHSRAREKGYPAFRCWQHASEVDKTSSDLWEVQVGHHGSNIFGERGALCA